MVTDYEVENLTEMAHEDGEIRITLRKQSLLSNG
jgi:hypothetical protein